MNSLPSPLARLSALCATVAMLTTSLLLADFVSADAMAVKLTGNEEVPAVTTSASGEADISVGADKLVSGFIKTSGIVGTAAHIHLAAKGKNGPPIVTLVKGVEDKWNVPAGTKFTDSQMQSYKAGDLYVNVHSSAHPNGEIRGQLVAR